MSRIDAIEDKYSQRMEERRAKGDEIRKQFGIDRPKGSDRV